MKLTDDELKLLDERIADTALTSKWEQLCQNALLNEHQFIKFSKDRGIAIRGIVKGDPSDFSRQGLLDADGKTRDSSPLYHPFRLFVVDHLIRDRDRGIEQELLRKHAHLLNSVVKLLILLEPIFWPDITNRTTFRLLDIDSHCDELAKYQKEMYKVLSVLDHKQWRELHTSIKFHAESLDDNSELYLLLRLAHWDQRKKLKGRFSASLWFRHMAEVLRRGFEKIRSEEWREEDYSGGLWDEGSRALVYGSERPLDNRHLAKQNLLRKFGLLTGSVVRWYVEGETEFHAILELIPSPAKLNIEVVNLRGNVATEKQNIALKLADCLIADIDLRRFSFITYDKDVSQNVKTIELQIKNKMVCGIVGENDPDFEFANFTLEELVTIAAELDKSRGFDPTPIINADWSNVKKAKDFEKIYVANSQSRRKLKGEDWGIALARFMWDNPTLEGQERAFIRQLGAATRASRVNYDLEAEHFREKPRDLSLRDT